MKFKVGDEVRIKSWEDMVAEYGLKPNGNINCDCVFAERMKGYCGRQSTITKIIYNKYYKLKSYPQYIFTQEHLEKI